MQIGTSQIVGFPNGSSVIKRARNALLCSAICAIVTTPVFAQSATDTATSNNPVDLETMANATADAIDPNPLPDVDLSRQNLRTDSIDPIRQTGTDTASSGVRVGTMVLRSSLQNQIFYESEKVGTASEYRVYDQTTLDVSLESDWSRHSLTLSGSGTYEENLRGNLSADPTVDLGADVILDLSDAVTANIQGSYNYSVDDRSDPNANSGATEQADVNTFGLIVGLSRNEGILRGSVTGELTREIHGDATLSDNSIISGDDRDLLSAAIKARLQYAANPALMPFIEAEYGRTEYDQTLDANGLERSYASYALRVGAAADFGEKLTGETSLGYVVNNYDDVAFANIEAISANSSLNWSPLRGTDATLAFSTEISPSTAAGETGSILYALEGNVSHQITNRLLASLGANYSFRDYKGTSAAENRTIYGANIGMDWAINPHLSLNADAGYTKTQQNGASDIDNLMVGLGLTLSR